MSLRKSWSESVVISSLGRLLDLGLVEHGQRAGQLRRLRIVGLELVGVELARIRSSSRKAVPDSLSAVVFRRLNRHSLAVAHSRRGTVNSRAGRTAAQPAAEADWAAAMPLRKFFGLLAELGGRAELERSSRTA